MKRKVLLSSAALLAAVSLAASGNNSNSTSEAETENESTWFVPGSHWWLANR